MIMPGTNLGYHTLLGNQIGKNTIFYVKKVFLFTKQQSLQSLHGFFTKKNSRKSPKIGQKDGSNPVF